MSEKSKEEHLFDLLLYYIDERIEEAMNDPNGEMRRESSQTRAAMWEIISGKAP